MYLARVLGPAEVTAALGGDPRYCPLPLSEERAGHLRRLVGERLEGLARALVQEAAASDEVRDLPSALRYLWGRLQDLAPVLREEDGERLWAMLQAQVRSWDAPFDPRQGSG